jgi:aspartyl-tRNA(Asn)/glutamyl-tRNA(Gln) amidotransferase subunit A
MTTLLAFTPAIELAHRIRTRAVSPVEVTRTLLERIEQVNPRINAFSVVMADEALEAAREAEAAVMRGDALGLLHGVPVSIKDLINVRGQRTMRGSRLYANYLADFDSPVVHNLRAAGAIVFCKTTTPEFGWKGATDSPVTGITRNPWNLAHTPGGSSGGASAQVAAGLGPLAVGTDGAGSIRIPSSLTGIFGFKQTFGRVPSYPASAVGVLAHTGPMTRTVRDAALLLNAMVGPNPRDPFAMPHTGEDFVAVCDGGVAGLRVAWSPDLGYVPVDPRVREACATAAQAFASLGAHVEEVTAPFADPAGIVEVLWVGGIGAALRDHLPQRRHELDPGLAAMIDAGVAFTAQDYARAMQDRIAFIQTVLPLFERFDLLLTPTMPTVAWPVEGPFPYEPNGESSARFRYTPFTFPFNITGQPAATVPCGFVDGLPVGLQIVGRRYDDSLVLRASAAFEAARSWVQHIPPGFE